ncbi:bifunctional GNAT family N-acetyltransferase/acetate--CoA ligase family protein [Janibacter terrae]|uniref:Bifunctional GNAT family N-acetyltransferase/acetate--CoA ligase family protein n=1 Tax=Janibacter terrae TaxID=103817 RepID=A0ABZ2FCW5_9MICO|nr:bifunctional GNAT family N-acetyltransferase/acetate--CoA ligase family protein [Janibacter terrae]MBA4084154.1 GNAT family N-acetyltransferase [Kytococcus sp.]HBO55179.1 GNAT family N-acetyltransferase [Janibacter terrae]
MTELPAGYPVLAEADVVLRDGSVCRLRPIRPSDADAVRRFHAGQSDESIYLRFFAPMRNLSDRDVKRFTELDYHDRMALVATIRDDIIGIGRYDRVSEHSAEVAFNISDHYQGKGIGSVLLEHLAAIAQSHDITAFEAEVLPHNRKMLRVFSDAGYQVTRHLEDGVVSVHFDIEPTAESLSVRFAREHRAEAQSVRAMLHPQSVAVVGASRRERAIGHQVLKQILDGGFTGAVHAINPEAGEILGLDAVRSVGEVEGGVDLAVIAVPAERVPRIVGECAAAGVKTLLIISSGFAEVDEHGARMQQEVLRLARSNGMRVVGPNSFGLINNDPAVSLNATLTSVIPRPGYLGLFSQSGALAIANLDSAARRNLGISVFASAGNRVDVSGNDLMQYWVDDERTHAVGLYLESMGNPRKFSRIARHLATNKPVIVVKPASAGYGAPPGHKVRKPKVKQHAFAAMLEQAGVIHCENVHQMFDVAQLLVHQPLPAGRRVAIVGNSSQLAALCADNATERGLEVTHGPVAVRTEATAAEFREAVGAAFADPEVDSVVVCFIPPVGALDQEVVEALREAASTSDKPCVATLLGMRGVDMAGDPSFLHELGEFPDDAPRQAVPLYAMPEEAIRALAAATDYGAWRDKDKGETVVREGIDRWAVRHLLDRVLEEDPEGRALTTDEAHELLSAYGIQVWPRIEVDSVEEAVAAAEQVGYPVVVKSLSPLVRGQAVLEGIRVDLPDADAVRVAYETLDRRLAPMDANYLVVQRMAGPGVATVLSTIEDPLFGPVVSFSIAGAPTKLLDDIAYRIPPLTDVDTRELIQDIKTAPLLMGHGGAAPVDLAALEDVLGRLSVMSDDFLELSSVELNPVIAHPSGVTVLGADIMITPAHRRIDPDARSMT